MKVMVVDDERLIVQGITMHLQKMKDANLTVVGAYSGAEALKTMEFFTPDLLITDIRMPDMDGLTLIAEARKRGLCDTFIILTAYEVFEYARQAVENQVLCYLVKPIDWAVLERHIRELTMTQRVHVDVAGTLACYRGLYAHIARDDLSHTLGKIVKYIHQNFTKNISLLQLSIYSGLSENYICTLFKKELGITFLDYVYELRLKYAMELLLAEEGKTIQEIAKRVGYHSDRQFFRIFRDRLGMPPQKFRDHCLRAREEGKVE